MLLFRPETAILCLALIARYVVTFVAFVLTLRRVPANQRADLYATFVKACTHAAFLGRFGRPYRTENEGSEEPESEADRPERSPRH